MNMGIHKDAQYEVRGKIGEALVIEYKFRGVPQSTTLYVPIQWLRKDRR